MAIVLNDITSGYNLPKINANFQKIEDYINQKLLARASTGVAGEAMMERDLDMNGKTILNALVNGVFLDDVIDQLNELVELEASLEEMLQIILNAGGFNLGMQVASLALLRLVNPVVDRQPFYVSGYRSGSSLGGGMFYYDATDTTSLDDDGAVIVTNSGKRIKRAIDGGVTPEMFGAKPNDSSFDSLPSIQNAINAAAGKYSVNFGKGTYYTNGAMYIPSKSQLNGNGCLIKTLALSSAGFMAGAIFAPGNYHPVYVDPVPKIGVTYTQGSNAITTASSTGLSVGDIIRLSSTDGIIGSDAVLVPIYMRMFRITEISGTSIKLDKPVQYSGTLVAMAANQPSYLARFNKPLFICSDSIVKDFRVDTWDYWVADSATYNTHFQNISGKANAVVYGNTYCASSFRNIDIEFTRRVSELAFGSHDTYLNNIIAKASPNGVSGSEMISWAESGSNCHLDGFTFYLHSLAAPSVVCRFTSFENSSIKNGYIYLTSNSNNILSMESYGGSRPGCNYNFYENIEIECLTSSAVVCNLLKSAADSILLSAVFKNIRYKGPTPSVALVRATGFSGNEITLASLEVESLNGGQISFSNSSRNSISVRGPATVSSLVTTAASNKISIYGILRGSAKANNFRLENSTSITGTDTSPLYTFTYPANSLRVNDTISFKVAGSTSGNGGTKTIQYGFLDSSSTFIPVGVTAVAGGTGFSFEGEISFYGSFAVITGTVNNNGTISGVRTAVGISSLVSTAFTVQIKAYNAVAGDTIVMQRIENQLNGLTE